MPLIFLLKVVVSSLYHHLSCSESQRNSRA